MDVGGFSSEALMVALSNLFHIRARDNGFFTCRGSLSALTLDLPSQPRVVLPDEGVDTCIHDDDIGCTLAVDEDL
jgi:hypothetical protein